jgi:hypothetical protein
MELVHAEMRKRNFYSVTIKVVNFFMLPLASRVPPKTLFLSISIIMQLLSVNRKSLAHSITCSFINFLLLCLKQKQVLYLISRTNALLGVAFLLNESSGR